MKADPHIPTLNSVQTSCVNKYPVPEPIKCLSIKINTFKSMIWPS